MYKKLGYPKKNYLINTTYEKYKNNAKNLQIHILILNITIFKYFLNFYLFSKYRKLIIHE